jgi:hypothetical protein
MTLTTKIYCSRQYLLEIKNSPKKLNVGIRIFGELLPLALPLHFEAEAFTNQTEVAHYAINLVSSR